MQWKTNYTSCTFSFIVVDPSWFCLTPWCCTKQHKSISFIYWVGVTNIHVIDSVYYGYNSCNWQRKKYVLKEHCEAQPKIFFQWSNLLMPLDLMRWNCTNLLWDTDYNWDQANRCHLSGRFERWPHQDYSYCTELWMSCHQSFRAIYENQMWRMWSDCNYRTPSLIYKEKHHHYCSASSFR